ncbi:MAG: PorV/PorQ family protein, partial [Gemmatimonadales bacterium]
AMKHSIATRWALAGALLLGLPAAAAAQVIGPGFIPNDNTAYGTTSGEFLLLGGGARGTALGASYAALAGDVSALYYNPAGIAQMNRPQAEVGSYNYVAGTKYTWGGIAFPVSGGVRSFGLQIGTFGFRDQPVYTVDQPDGTGSLYNVSETFAAMTYAQNFSDRFAAGLTAKFVSDQLGDASGSAFAVDFGTNFHAMLNNKPIRLAFTVTNLGTGMSYSGAALNTNAVRDQATPDDPIPAAGQPAELRSKAFPLPTAFRVALGYDLLSQPNNRLSLITEFDQPNDNAAGFGVGAEWAMPKLGSSPFGVALRGSYTYAAANTIKAAMPTAISLDESLQGLAGGGGLSYASGDFNLGFDYAFKFMGVLGFTHFFSFTVGW